MRYRLLAFLLLATNSLASERTLIAPDGTTVTISRDEYGVPHITAESEVGVFFGQGFAVAEDRLYQMEQFRRIGEGKLSEWNFLAQEIDTETLTMFYTPEERRRQFEELPRAMQVVLESYSAGINTYLDSMEVNPEKFTPKEFHQLFTVERWTPYKSVAIIQYLTRSFGQAGGQELTRLADLQRLGREQFEREFPINDPDAPTTIAAAGTAAERGWRYSGISVRPQVIDAIHARQQANKETAEQLRVPLKFGSFAVLISQAKSSSGHVMLLGAPQMGAPEENQPNIVHEVELNCPTLHVAGMTVAGIPLVIIGHTDVFAWSLTSGLSDNRDVYIETTQDNSYSKYLYGEQWLDFEVIDDTISTVFGKQPLRHYRTIHGPVFGDDLENNQVYAMKMTFWNRELDMAVSFYDMIKARTLEEFEAALAGVPVSFNAFYAGQDQRIKFWHVGRYQDREDGIDPRLPHNGDGSEEWQGFIPFEELPQAGDTEQSYFVNWNNKPVAWWDNGDDIPWAGDTRQTMRVLDIDAFVGPISSFPYDDLKDVPRQIGDFGTYQQAIELSGDSFIDENLVAPGQSDFSDINGVPSPHTHDQWDLHLTWSYKDMQFSPSMVTEVATRQDIPLDFDLLQNYPNPFNPATTIRFTLTEPGQVVLQVFNLNGRLVATLVHGVRPAGTHSVTWNAEKFSSGVYVYRLRAGGVTVVKKAILLR